LPFATAIQFPNMKSTPRARRVVKRIIGTCSDQNISEIDPGPAPDLHFELPIGADFALNFGGTLPVTGRNYISAGTSRS
jgi:hypothetical protein